ncbi:hypothetical protein BZG17_25515, partial [Escherichia coli]|nr:hypothetical protein [Escherichia coli]
QQALAKFRLTMKHFKQSLIPIISKKTWILHHGLHLNLYDCVSPRLTLVHQSFLSAFKKTAGSVFPNQARLLVILREACCQEKQAMR